MDPLMSPLDPAVKALCAKHGFVSTRCLGSGMFSLVFPGESKVDADIRTVLKFTLDKATYALLTRHRPWERSIHFPRLVKDHGIVGELQLDAVNKEPVYLLEIEHLERSMFSPLEPLADAVTKAFHRVGVRIMGSMDYLDMDKRTPQNVTAILREVATEELMLPVSIRHALLDLSRFAWEYRHPKGSNIGAGIDFHGENFMRRGNTLIFSDPIIDRHLHESYSGIEHDEEDTFREPLATVPA